MPGTPVKKIRYRWKPPYEGPRTPASKLPPTPLSVLPRAPKITHTSAQTSPAQKRHLKPLLNANNQSGLGWSAQDSAEILYDRASFIPTPRGSDPHPLVRLVVRLHKLGPAQGPQSRLPGKADSVLSACGTEIPPLPSIQSSDEPYSNTPDPEALIRGSHLPSIVPRTEPQHFSASIQSRELRDVYLMNAEQPVYVNGVLDHANQLHTIDPGLVVPPATVNAVFDIEVYSGPEIEEYLFGPGHESLDSV